MGSFTYSNVEENRFWLQIIGDSAMILLYRLPHGTTETQLAQEAKGFADRFDGLIARSRQNLTPDQMKLLNQDAFQTTQEIRVFFLRVLANLITLKSFIFLKPAYLNNMVSYTDEYLYLLSTFLNNKQPIFTPIVQDIFWLPIFYTNARFIADNIGTFEEGIRQKALSFMNSFTYFFEYAVAMQGVLRTGVEDFPIQRQYRTTIREEMHSFAIFLVDLLKLIRQNMLPGTITPLELDSIYRILCYYTTQLSIIDDIEKPTCDPARPRLTLF